MTTKLKRIDIGSQTWPQLPPQKPPKQVMVSKACAKRYVPSVAAQGFGTLVQHTALKTPAQKVSSALRKAPWLKLALATLLILGLTGLTLAEASPVVGLRSDAVFPINFDKDQAMFEKEVWPTTVATDRQAPGTLPAASQTPGAASPMAQVSAAGAPTQAPTDQIGAESTLSFAALATFATLGALPLVFAAGRRRSQPIGSSATALAPAPDTQTVPRGPTPCAGDSPLAGIAYVEPAVLLASMQRSFPQLRIVPASQSYSLVSLTGHNNENQDYALAFDLRHASLGPIQVCFIADGCGGHFGGRDAAYTATCACVTHLLKDAQSDNIGTLANNCMQAASEHVARVGTALWGQSDFRTTLIVLVASANEYQLAYIGDGGMDVRRVDGSWERLLTPMREEKTGYLTGSLGPTRYGVPIACSAPRLPGDFLVVGSDGLYVEQINSLEEFTAWPRRSIQAEPANLGAILSQYVQKCLDSNPTVFDDNITAMVMTTPQAEENIVATGNKTPAASAVHALASYNAVAANRA